jgi:nicotinamidase/pyrazinamidase
MSKAFIVVGLQYDHLPGGKLPIPGTENILTPIRQRILQLDDDAVVIAGREWHPENHFTFELPWDGHDALPPHCLQGTKGARIHTGILKYCDYVVAYGQDKNKEGYSAFEGKSLRPVEELEVILARHGVTEVEVAGVSFAYEVMQTALDSNAVGLPTSITIPLTNYVHEDTPALDEAIRKLDRAQVELRG